MKKITYILCMLVASVMFTACTSDDYAENQEVKVYHDEKGNYIPITVSADISENSGSRAIEPGLNYCFRAKPSDTDNYTFYSKIVIVLNGICSELDIVNSTISSDRKSASFSGRLYYGDILPDANTVLRAYIKTYYTQINPDGSYEMLTPTEFNYGLAEHSVVGEKDPLNGVHCYDHGVYYAETKYGSNINFNFNPITAILRFNIKMRDGYFDLDNYWDYYTSDKCLQLHAKGIFNAGASKVSGSLILSGRSDYYLFDVVVDTRYTVSDVKIQANMPGTGATIERRVNITSSNGVRLKPGAVYEASVDMAPKAGDYYYSNGGWGDLLPDEMYTKKDIIGIVCGATAESYQGTNQKRTRVKGIAISLSDEGSSTGEVFHTDENFTYDPYRIAGTALNNITTTDMWKGLDRIETLKNCNAQKKAIAKSVGPTKWFLPTAGDMNYVIQKLFNTSVKNYYASNVVYNVLDRNYIQEQINRLNEYASTSNGTQQGFAALNQTYWTSSFVEMFSYPGPYAASLGTSSSENAMRGNIVSATNRIRPITYFGWQFH